MTDRAVYTTVSLICWTGAIFFLSVGLVNTTLGEWRGGGFQFVVGLGYLVVAQLCWRWR